MNPNRSPRFRSAHLLRLLFLGWVFMTCRVGVWAQAEVQIQIERRADERGYEVVLMGTISGAGKLDENETGLRVLISTNSVPPEIRAAVLEIAGLAYRSAKEADCGLNSRLPARDRKAKGMAAIETMLRQRNIGWFVSASGSTKLDSFALEFPDGKPGLPTGLRVELRNLRDAESGQPDNEAEMERRRKRALEEARLLGILAGTNPPTGTFVPPALDEVEVRRRLSGERRIDVPSDALSRDEDGTLVVRLNRVGRPLGLAFEAGAAYSSADRFTANGSVELVNARRQFDNSKVAFDTLSARGRYGPQVRELDGIWNVPLRAEGEQFGAGIDLNGGYLENDRTALGGTDGQTAFSRRQGGEFGANVGYDSYTLANQLDEFLGVRDLSTLPLRFTGVLGVGVKYEDTEVARTVVGGIRSGTAAELRLNGSGSMIRMLRGPTEPGIGRLSLDVLGNHQQGVDGVGGEFSYSRSEVGLAVEMQFGFERSRDFLVRELVRVGLATGNLPTLEEFRIGGGSAVRGLQEGEISGRSVVALSGEFGVNLGLLTGVHRAKPDAGEEPKSIWSRLDGVYLKGFLDWARVTSDGGFQGAGRDSAFGTGLMLELPRELLGGVGSKGVPSISLGYAYSPDSRIHRAGMFAVSTSLPF
jgi:hypothetical protein